MTTDNQSGPTVLKVFGQNVVVPWCRLRMSTTPVLSDAFGVSTPTSVGSGVFTVSFKYAFPKPVILLQSYEGLAGSHGMAKLTSLSANRKTATIEFYKAASGAAPTLSDGLTTDFLNMAFLCMDR